MNRLMAGYRESISTALVAIPAPIRERLRHVDFLTGTDPVFAGLHRYEDANLGRSYRSIAHYASPHYGCADTTIVLPVPDEPVIIIHELGHALDESLAFRHDAEPVTWYAKTNRIEAFAEAFTAWVTGRSGVPVGGWSDHYAAARSDPSTTALFERLAAVSSG